MNLAYLQLSVGNLPEARQALEAWLPDEGAEDADEGWIPCADLLALWSRASGEREEARRLARRALRSRERALGDAHPDLALLLNLVAILELESDESVSWDFLVRLNPDLPSPDVELAVHYLDRTAAVQRRSIGDDHPDLAATLVNRGIVARGNRDTEAATRHFRQALAMQERHLHADHREIGVTLRNLAGLLEAQFESREPESLLHRAARIAYRTSLPPLAMDDLPCLGTSFHSVELGLTADDAAAFHGDPSWIPAGLLASGGMSSWWLLPLLELRLASRPVADEIVTAAREKLFDSIATCVSSLASRSVAASSASVVDAAMLTSFAST